MRLFINLIILACVIHTGWTLCLRHTVKLSSPMAHVTCIQAKGLFTTCVGKEAPAKLVAYAVEISKSEQ